MNELREQVMNEVRRLCKHRMHTYTPLATIEWVEPHISEADTIINLVLDKAVAAVEKREDAWNAGKDYNNGIADAIQALNALRDSK